MKKIGSMTQAELAAYAQTALRKDGINVVLTGGAAVAFYSDGKYTSRDLDFVDLGFASFQKIKSVMSALNFRQAGKHFESAETDHIIEFVASPLSVGNQPVAEISKIKLSTGILNVISATDCVKDRLAAFFYWNDLQALNQALLVAHSKKIKLREVERWARAEGMETKFKQFLAKLKGSKKA